MSEYEVSWNQPSHEHFKNGNEMYSTLHGDIFSGKKVCESFIWTTEQGRK